MTHISSDCHLIAPLSAFAGSHVIKDKIQKPGFLFPKPELNCKKYSLESVKYKEGTVNIPVFF